MGADLVVLAGLALGVAAGAGGYLRFAAAHKHLTDPIETDDWREVATRAATMVARRDRRSPSVGATTLAGLAELVTGDLRAARRWLEQALVGPQPWRDMALRQLASVDRIEGDFDAARARLAALHRPSAPHRWATDVQLGLLELDEGHPATAEAVLAGAAEELRRRRRRRVLPRSRAAFASDLAQALALLVRARRLQGDLRGGGAVAQEAAAVGDGRPYVAGMLATERAALERDAGNLAAAARHIDAALAAMGRVGARLDHARALGVRASIRSASGDAAGAAADTDAAAEVFTEAGAVTYLRQLPDWPR